jgi:glycosyltransferase involved in cell wall biosynthesis
VAGGRAAVDWDTLRAAALPDLETVCTAADAGRAPGRVRVDVPHDEFTASLPGRVSVFVIALREAGIAQGHVRVKDAIDAGVPIVATRVRALAGVLDDGSALLVPEGDAEALREAVGRLRGDRALAERLRRSAWERAGAWTWDDYLAAMARFAGSQSMDGLEPDTPR